MINAIVRHVNNNTTPTTYFFIDGNYYKLQSINASDNDVISQIIIHIESNRTVQVLPQDVTAKNDPYVTVLIKQSGVEEKPFRIYEKNPVFSFREYQDVDSSSNMAGKIDYIKIPIYYNPDAEESKRIKVRFKIDYVDGAINES